MMGFIGRFMNRLRFRRQFSRDESNNVVDSIVKARALYRELCVRAHPDRNPDKREVADNLMQRITANKFNYSELLILKKEIEKTL